jgi:intracellular septation protein
MTEAAKKTSWLIPVLEIGPIFLFFLVFSRLKDQTYTVFGREYSGFIATTAAFVVITLISTFLIRMLSGRVSKLQLFTLGVVLFMGGLSVWLNDEHFIKMKPTLIYGVYGAALMAGLLRGKLYIRVLMENSLPLTEEGYRFLSWRLALLFLGMALANEVVWRSVSTESWVWFKTFLLTGVSIVGMGYIFFKLDRFTIPEEGAPEDKA